MSQYVVFRCKKCEKVGVSESRKNISPKKVLKCKYCGRSSILKASDAIRVCSSPTSAKDMMNRINLEDNPYLDQKEKELIFTEGYFFGKAKSKIPGR